DTVRVPDAVFFKVALHHATVRRAPGRVITIECVPGLLHGVPLIVDFLHFANSNLELQHDSFMLKELQGVPAGLLEVTADINTRS
ncbi:hypothetical protein ANANG_G00123320, partial [Anguilla anguilla]